MPTLRTLATLTAALALTLSCRAQDAPETPAPPPTPAEQPGSPTPDADTPVRTPTDDADAKTPGDAKLGTPVAASSPAAETPAKANAGEPGAPELDPEADAAAIADAAEDAPAPGVTLLDAGAEPRDFLRRAFRPGDSERLVATTTSTSIAIVDGTKYPPDEGEPVHDEILATVRSVDESGAATIDLVLTEPIPAPDLDHPGAEPTPASKQPPPLRAAARIDRQGFVTDVVTGAPKGDAAGAQKLAFWDRKLRLLTVPIPPVEIGVGAQWSVTNMTKLDGVEVPQTMKYTLESVEDGVYTVSATLSIASHAERPMDLGDMSDPMQGTITGMLVNSAVRVSFTMDRALPLSGADESEVVLLSRIHAKDTDAFQLAQYVQNHLTVRSPIAELATVEDDAE